MAVTMSHAEWLKFTDGGTFSVRSSELKAVDNALRDYHTSKSDLALATLQGALLKWMQAKGSDWKSSVRNKNNAVDNLYKQVTGLGTGQPKNPLELSRVRDESRAILTDLFHKRELVFRPGLLTKIAGNSSLSKASVMISVGSNAKTGYDTYKLASGPSTGPSIASRVLKEIIPAEVFSDVLAALASVMPEFMTKWAAAMMPFAGLIASGGGAVVSAASTLWSQYKLVDARMHAERTLSEDEPDAAMAAVVRMLERERNKNLAELTIGMADFAAKLASLLLDGGTASNTAISITSGVMKLVVLVRVVVRDIMERNKANALVNMPIVKKDLFEACPVMGAYLVCCAPTSVIVNTILSSDEFYNPGMMDKVERAVQRHVQPMREAARKLVTEHRMYIPALQNYPGVLERNEKKLKEMMANKGKTAIGQQHESSAV